MSDSTSVTLHEWLWYQSVWLIVGCGLILLLLGWYAFVFFVTRRTSQRTMAQLPPKPYIPPDLTALRAKYLQLIDQAEQSHASGAVSARKLHQTLSYLLRMFAYEATGHRLDVLTLHDLERTRYTQLATAVKAYYTPEFAAVKTGNITEALIVARKVVNEWS